MWYVVIEHESLSRGWNFWKHIKIVLSYTRSNSSDLSPKGMFHHIKTIFFTGNTKKCHVPRFAGNSPPFLISHITSQFLMLMMLIHCFSHGKDVRFLELFSWNWEGKILVCILIMSHIWKREISSILTKIHQLNYYWNFRIQKQWRRKKLVFKWVKPMQCNL